MQPDSPDRDAPQLGRSAAAGAMWLTGQKWLVRLSGLATVALLTRMISPEDFGEVAAATALTPFVFLLADLGFSAYVVQSRELSPRLLSSGFWFSVLASAVLATGLFLAAPLLAQLYNVPDSAAIFRFVALAVPFAILGSIPSAILRRRMAFRTLALQNLIATLIGQAIAIAMAIGGLGAWALVVQVVAAQVVTTVLAWRSSRWRPTKEFSFDEFRSMGNFGVKVVSIELIATGRIAAESAVISSALGASALGYFAIATRLVQVAQDAAAAALIPVSVVVFARVRESIDRLANAYVKSMRVAYAAVSPVLTYVSVAAPVLVPFLFGNEWRSSVPVVQALGIAAIMTLGAMIDNGLHYGTGSPGRWLGYAVLVELATVGTTFVLAPRGLNAVAAGFVAVALCATMGRWMLVARLVKLPARRLAGEFGLAAVPVFVSWLAGAFALMASEQLPDIASLAVAGISVLAVHLGVIRLIRRDLMREVVVLLPLPRAVTSKFGKGPREV